ncbi:MAG: Peptidyl-prolyl cis-trans isomerase [Candidatus Thorarchaeota archaeon]|nr:MAG: Peptidyl-prolyl cis-trans isomerase [Candidatus Thorarchaeota archaeon]
MSEKEPKKKTKKKTKANDVVAEKSVIYIDYTAKTKEDETVFDTTLEEVAHEKGIYKDNERYQPMLVALGWNWLLEALEEEIVGMKVGEKKTIEIPPERGAGFPDPKKIKTIAKTKLAKHGDRPIKGETITFGRERGVITAVMGRTVRVDFNSPLAGKTLIFDVEVKDIITDPLEKLQAVVKRRIPVLEEDRFSISIEGEVIIIELPKETRYIENIAFGEVGIASDALKIYEEAKSVKICTIFDRPEENQT